METQQLQASLDFLEEGRRILCEDRTRINDDIEAIRKKADAAIKELIHMREVHVAEKVAAIDTAIQALRARMPQERCIDTAQIRTNAFKEN